MASYRDYLTSDHWEGVRKSKQKSVRRSGSRYRCDRCKIYFLARFMETHHRHYKSVGKERKEDLEALCIWCHSAEHGKRLPIVDKEKVLTVFGYRQSLTDGEMNDRRNNVMDFLDTLT